MLKGYLLANIDEAKRTAANTRWRDRIRELNGAGKEVESDFFKAWLRGQHSTKIRERKKGAKPEDFDRIGTDVSSMATRLPPTRARDSEQSEDSLPASLTANLRTSDFYSRQYLRLIEAAGRSQ